MYNPLYEAVNVIVEDVNSVSYGRESAEVLSVLENVNSPQTAKYKELLYNEILEKAHIDFDDIPKSQGDITKYSGYHTMIQTISTIKKMAQDEKNKDVEEYCDTVQKAIDNIRELSGSYRMGFTTRTEYVALEYNVFTCTCVEATTALLNNYIDYLRVPGETMMPKLKNTKIKKDAFYFEMLRKYNKVQEIMGIEYRQMLEHLCNTKNDKNQFIGTSTAVGVAAVSAAILSILPITRALITQIYTIRVDLSKELEYQAKFLELNSEAVKRSAMDSAQKDKVVKKQENLVKTLRRWADKLRVKSASSIDKSQREIASKNKKISLDSLRDDVSNSNDDFIFA